MDFGGLLIVCVAFVCACVFARAHYVVLLARVESLERVVGVSREEG